MGRTRVGAMTLATLALFLGLIGGAFVGTSRGAAQEESPPRPSHVHSGDCDEPGPIVQPLTALTVPGGERSGNDEAVLAEAAFSSIPLTLEEMLAADHAIKVHLSQAEIETYLACGDLGGAVDADGALIVGLKEQDGSGWTGIAYLVPAGDGGTSVSVMIAKVLPGGGAGDAGEDEAAAEELAAEDEGETGGDEGEGAGDADAGDEGEAAGSGDGVEVVGVALSEFAI